MAPVAMAVLGDVAASSALASVRRRGREHNDAIRAAKKAEIQRVGEGAQRRSEVRRLVAAASAMALIMPVGGVAAWFAQSYHDAQSAAKQPLVVATPITPTPVTDPNACPGSYTLVSTKDPPEVMHSKVVVLEFKGSYWRTTAGARQASHMTNWMGSLSGTNYMNVFNSYGDAQGPIGTQMDVRAVYDSTDPPSSVCFAEVRPEVEKMMSVADAVVPPGDQPVYLVILPPGTVLGDARGLCGLHYTYTAQDRRGHDLGGQTKVVYGVASSACDPRFTLNYVALHEAGEAFADPYVNNGSGEIGDPCESAPMILINGDYATSFWDQALGRCQVQADLEAPKMRSLPPVQGEAVLS